MSKRMTITQADIARLSPAAQAQIEAQITVLPRRKPAPARVVRSRRNTPRGMVFVPALIVFLLIVWRVAVGG